ncbi:MAG: regulatory protein RecX [Nitriliruptoraceae bacterium]
MPRDAEEWLARRGIERRPLIDPVDAAPPQEPASVPAMPSADDAASAEALAFVRRSASMTPQSEGRLRDKLAQRGFDDHQVEATLVRARSEGLVDDRRMAQSLVDEARARGHALLRIRRDLGARGFDRDLIASLLAPYESEDQQAVAFELARQRAAQLTGETAETAFRRVAGHVARRGHPDALARKVARDAVFALREEQRTADR